MTPDLELLADVLGREPSSWEVVNKGGYTRSHSWRAMTRNGAIFVKQAEDEGSLHMLRREALVYQSVRGPFLPALAGFADGGDRAVLAVEYIEGAAWPPPYADDVSPLFDALAMIATTDPPPALPAQRPRSSRWELVAADPEPFLGLRLCSRGWLERSVDALAAAEADADFTGDSLVHNDVYAGNVAFTPRGAVLVDWGAAVRGSSSIDLALALLSVRVEGGTPPTLDFPDAAPFVAAFAGHFAAEAPLPLPDWAEPGSTLREDMAGDLAHALRWAANLLELPPPA